MREQEEPTISPSVTSIAKSGAVVVLGLRQDADTDAIFDIFDDVVERGDGYPNVAPLTKDVFDAIWCTPRRRSWPGSTVLSWARTT